MWGSRRAGVVSLRRMRTRRAPRDQRPRGYLQRVRGGADVSRRHTRATRDVDAAGRAARLPNRLRCAAIIKGVAPWALVAEADARVGAGGGRGADLLDRIDARRDS